MLYHLGSQYNLGTWFEDYLDLVTPKVEFDATRLKLGRLCKRGHDWNQTGQSLRRKNDNHCVECGIERTRKYRQNNREKAAECQRKYRRNNSEKVLERDRRYRQGNKEKITACHRKYRQSNKGKVAERSRRYYQTDAGKQSRRRGRINYQFNKLNNHSVPYQESKILDLFGGHCAYCGIKSDKLTIDHFLPISKGGTDTEMNALPACKSCNSSKHNKDPKEWYFSQKFTTEKGWKKILKTIGKTDANYNQLPLL